jgi:hypothetical protein
MVRGVERPHVYFRNSPHYLIVLFRQGAVLAQNGVIYGIPCNSNEVLRIDPVRLEVSTFGKLPPGKDKYQGGVLAPDGSIYCVPENARDVLKITPGRSSDSGSDKIALLSS